MASHRPHEGVYYIGHPANDAADEPPDHAQNRRPPRSRPEIQSMTPWIAPSTESWTHLKSARSGVTAFHTSTRAPTTAFAASAIVVSPVKIPTMAPMIRLNESIDRLDAPCDPGDQPLDHLAAHVEQGELAPEDLPNRLNDAADGRA